MQPHLLQSRHLPTVWGLSMRTLRLARPPMEGPDVEYAQKRLIRHGLALVKVTGIYDGLTATMVRAFQSMLNLKPTGEVDEVTWNQLTDRTPYYFPIVTGKRADFITACLQLIGVPYIHGSSAAMYGLDPVGFLYAAGQLIRVEQPDKQRGLPLGELLSFCKKLPEEMVQPGDLAVYSQGNGVPTHILVTLNKDVGVGPLGGNASTTTPKAALQRDAFVKLKPIKYRQPSYFVDLASPALGLCLNDE